MVWGTFQLSDVNVSDCGVMFSVGPVMIPMGAAPPDSGTGGSDTGLA